MRAASKRNATHAAEFDRSGREKTAEVLESGMVKLHDVDTNLACGELSDEQFQVLVDALEEESSTDNDYYIHVETIELLESEGADAGLIKILRAALDNREEMELRWEKS